MWHARSHENNNNNKAYKNIYIYQHVPMCTTIGLAQRIQVSNNIKTEPNFFSPFCVARVVGGGAKDVGGLCATNI